MGYASSYLDQGFPSLMCGENPDCLQKWHSFPSPLSPHPAHRIHGRYIAATALPPLLPDTYHLKVPYTKARDGESGLVLDSRANW